MIVLIGLNAGITLADNGHGRITGRVMDAETREELIHVNIIISGSQRGTTTDTTGRFEITGLEAGIYNLEFRYLGYRTSVMTDVVVRNHRPTTLNILLQPGHIEGDEVTIRPTYFGREVTETVSRIGFNAEEIRRSPGAGQELSRVIMATPGVASNGDTSQDLLVRGGSPSENGFYIDHIPVPGVNHFERQNGRTSGPIGIVNTDLVEQLDFHAGGFPAAYGDHASSVAAIRYREGSRDDYHGNVNFNMAGFGLTLESPLFDGKGSVLLSGRRSYLDLLAGAINAGGAPRYGDVQVKAVYDINQDNKITLLNIYGDSLFENDLEEAREEGFDRYTRAHTWQNTTGLNWRRLWSTDFFSNTSISHSYKKDNTQLIFVEDLSRDIDFNILHSFSTLRNTNYYRLNDRHRFEFGFEAGYRSGDYDYYIGPTTNAAGVMRPESEINTRVDKVTAGTFAEWKVRPIRRLSFNLGGRADYHSLNNKLVFSPRAGVSFEVTRKLTLNASSGVFRQTLPLFYRSQDPEFEQLRDLRTTHFIAGFDYRLTPETMLTIEAYEKQYWNLPALPQDHNLGMEVYVMETEMYFDELVDDGKSYARGIDALVQKKLARNFYGMVSGSVFRSEFKDSGGSWRSRNFDVGYLFNILGGYRPNDRWEFSARWSYVGQRPMTPIDVEASRNSGTTRRDFSRFNEDRMPAYHSLFIRFDRRWFYNSLAVTTFMEIWNTYNRANVEAYYWSEAYEEIRSVNQFSTLPVGGVLLEF